MSVEFEPMHVRPMTETPDCVFKYVYNDGAIGVDYLSCDYNKLQESAVGWIPARFTPKPPEPKEGEWWMCRYKSIEIEGDVVLTPRNGKWVNMDSSSYPLNPSNVTPLYKMERATE